MRNGRAWVDVVGESEQTQWDGVHHIDSCVQYPFGAVLGRWSGIVVFYSGFFFSSRRRHTRCLSDCSSDVCSSDLQRRPERQPAGGMLVEPVGRIGLLGRAGLPEGDEDLRLRRELGNAAHGGAILIARSEERRVGKECRYGWSASQSKSKSDTKNRT